MRRLGQSGSAGIDLAGLFAPLLGYASIGLAVSGGPDSLALMLLTQRWAAATPGAPKLTVYSVDHRLRPEAAAEAAFVATEAARLGLSAHVLAWEGAKPSTGIQSAARTARYRLIGEAMARDGVQLLVTAHHRNDQAETVLMRMARGSGIGGLAGMMPFSSVEGVAIFHPLLDVGPTILHAVVAEAGITPLLDPSNANPAYERVRWRQALPQLAELGLTPERLSHLARRAGEADAAIDSIAADHISCHVHFDSFGSARLERLALAALPRAIATRVLSQCLIAVGGADDIHALGQIEALSDALRMPKTFKRTTLLGTVVAAKSDTIWLAREPGRSPLGKLALVPGRSLIWDRRFRITSQSARMELTVRMAHDWNRKGAQAFTGMASEGPIESIRASPLVEDGDGRVFALGAHVSDRSVLVAWLSPKDRLPQSGGLSNETSN
jgi:tRNA(Ile)-lysidine synthase